MERGGSRSEAQMDRAGGETEEWERVMNIHPKYQTQHTNVKLLLISVSLAIRRVSKWAQNNLDLNPYLYLLKKVRYFNNS